MTIFCANCGHPGVHAEVTVPGGGMPDRCEQCERCEAEREQQAEGRE